MRPKVKLLIASFSCFLLVSFFWHTSDIDTRGVANASSLISPIGVESTQSVEGFGEFIKKYIDQILGKNANKPIKQFIPPEKTEVQEKVDNVIPQGESLEAKPVTEKPIQIESQPETLEENQQSTENELDYSQRENEPQNTPVTPLTPENESDYSQRQNEPQNTELQQNATQNQSEYTKETNGQQINQVQQNQQETSQLKQNQQQAKQIIENQEEDDDDDD